MLDETLKAQLKLLLEQWNVAERRIKKAEAVQGNIVVTSAIFELRYAGRKLVDAMCLACENNLSTDENAYKQCHAFLADAIEDCVKAKHDAIDGMVDFIVEWFATIEKNLGLEALQNLFPEYLDTTAEIFDIQEKIAESREKRIQGRDGIYDEIEAKHYDKLLALYNKMRLSKARVEATVLAKRKKENLRDIGLWIGVGAGVLALIISIVVAVT